MVKAYSSLYALDSHKAVLLLNPRLIRRWVHEAEMEDMQTKLDASPQTAVVRKQTVEHPFGTIKMWMGQLNS